MDSQRLKPKALKIGDTVGIVAPAGTITHKSTFQQVLATLIRMGFRVRFEERIFDSYRYLAGSDAARAEELMHYFENPEIHAIIALRGGFGCSRLIPLLDPARLRNHCKLFIGFSDLTTLHLYFNRSFGWITMHGPMAASETLADLPENQAAHLMALWTNPDYMPILSFPTFESWRPGVAEGPIIGGCLSLLAASLGTSYEIETSGKVLFLEDLGEAPYRIDRMLTQLRLAGKLESLAGILLGKFTDCDPDQGDYTVQDVLRDLLTNLQIPVLYGFPAGHGLENWGLPLGIRVRMNADTRTLQFLESTVNQF